MAYTCPDCGKQYPAPPKACTCEDWSGVNVGESVRYVFAPAPDERHTLDPATFEAMVAALGVELEDAEPFTEPTAPYLGVETSWTGIETAAEVSWRFARLGEDEVARALAVLGARSTP